MMIQTIVIISAWGILWWWFNQLWWQTIVIMTTKAIENKAALSIFLFQGDASTDILQWSQRGFATIYMTWYRSPPWCGGYWDDLSLDLVGEQLIACRWFFFPAIFSHLFLRFPGSADYHLTVQVGMLIEMKIQLLLLFNSNKHQI